MRKITNRNTFLYRGIPFRFSGRREVVKRISELPKQETFCRIATVGPEFLLRAGDDAEFGQNLQRADLCVADGVGVVIAGMFFGKRLERFSGADLLLEIFEEAEESNLSIFLAAKKDGLSSLSEIRNALLKQYPTLRVFGEEYADSIHWQTHDTAPGFSGAQIVLCNFGAPEQEYFAESLRENAKSIKLCMGVGGAFDFLTGKIPRAPRLVRAVGFEWLWRLAFQPNRWRRVFRAVVIFPASVLVDKFCGK